MNILVTGANVQLGNEIAALLDERGIAGKDQSGMAKMQQLMANLRSAGPKEIAGKRVISVVDYQSPVTGLPAADVLSFLLEGNAKLMVRPSGTEPKIKAYLSARGNTRQEALDLVIALKDAAAELLK